jgi:hypothetical protein
LSITVENESELNVGVAWLSMLLIALSLVRGAAVVTAFVAGVCVVLRHLFSGL